MPFEAPVSSRIMHVEPAWIDYNGHLNMAYYNVFFDRAVDEAFTLLGMGPDYAKRRNASFYTLEAHVTYLSELHEGDPVRVSFRIVDFDAKRVHAFQELHHAEDGFLSATSETMTLHVDRTAKRAAPFPGEVHARIEEMHKAHGVLPRPPQLGHVIAIPRKPGARRGRHGSPA
jgi:acyl-CoA thioester hydrolase